MGTELSVVADGTCEVELAADVVERLGWLVIECNSGETTGLLDVLSTVIVSVVV